MERQVREGEDRGADETAEKGVHGIWSGEARSGMATKCRSAEIVASRPNTNLQLHVPMSSKPVYIVAAAGPARDACAAALGEAPEFISPPLAATALSEKAPGVVLVSAEALSATDLLGAARALPGPAWTLAVFDLRDPHTVQTLSLGYETEFDRVGRFAGHEGDGAEDLLELRRVLVEIARARHDINNPLTSALAETQILLLDAPEGEMRDGLEIVQTQLRRIRDLVAATRHMRPRR